MFTDKILVPVRMPTISFAWFLNILVVLSSIGALASCGAHPRTELLPQELHLRVLGTLYGHYMSQTAGRVPAKQAEFVAFLEDRSKNWESLASSAEELLTKTMDGSEIVVLFGKDVKVQSENGFPWVAYSRSSVDGNYAVADARGDVQMVDESELSQLFANAP